MIDYNPKSWVSLIFRFHRSEQMKALLPFLLFMGLYTAGVLFIFKQYVTLRISNTVSVHGLLGIVLGLVLVFRTNTAYARWWEGRGNWGGLINHSRNYALKVAPLLGESLEDRRFFATTIANFAYATKDHLRKGARPDVLELEGMPYESSLKDNKHVPLALVHALNAKVQQMLASGQITGDHYRELMRESNGMIDMLGGCEKIRKTPIAFSYITYIKKVIFVYLISLPVSFEDMPYLYAIPTVMFIAYTLSGLELIGEGIEDPFGSDDNDLDTDGMSNTIRTDVREILNVKTVSPGI